MKILKKCLWTTGTLVLLLAIFTVTALLGLLAGSGGDFWVSNTTLENEQPSEPIGDVYRVSHETAYEFVLLDRTNENEYREGYNCADFALELWRNAKWSGIECKLIGLDLAFGNDHMIVGFPNEAGKLLLVDPQTDAIMHPIIGINGFSSISEITFIKIPLGVDDGS